MTNEQIKTLRVGDYIDYHINGRVINLEVLEVRVIGADALMATQERTTTPMLA